MKRAAKISVSLVFAIALSHSVANAQESSDVAKIIVPFVQKHCAHCHGEKKPKGDLSLHVFKEEGAIWNGTETNSLSTVYGLPSRIT